MYIFFKEETRPSVTIPFYAERNPASSAYRKYFNDTYITTSIFILSVVTYSEDRLTLTNKMTWISRAGFLQFSTDSFCYDTQIIPNRIYNRENNIISRISVEESR